MNFKKCYYTHYITHIMRLVITLFQNRYYRATNPCLTGFMKYLLVINVFLDKITSNYSKNLLIFDFNNYGWAPKAVNSSTSLYN